MRRSHSMKTARKHREKCAGSAKEDARSCERAQRTAQRAEATSPSRTIGTESHGVRDVERGSGVGGAGGRRQSHGRGSQDGSRTRTDVATRSGDERPVEIAPSPRIESGTSWPRSWIAESSPTHSAHPGHRRAISHCGFARGSSGQAGGNECGGWNRVGWPCHGFPAMLRNRQLPRNSRSRTREPVPIEGRTSRRIFVSTADFRRRRAMRAS